jgi:glutaredoxin
MKSVLITMLMLTALQSAAAGELYRWVDKNGVIHYGDVPANDAQQLESKKFSEPPSAPSPSSFALERAKKNFPVTLYVIRNCGDGCKQARDFLTKLNIPYTEVLLQNQQEVNKFREKSGSDLSPTLAVGKDWLKGFQPDEWQDELNVAGYPGVKPSATSALGVPAQ